MATYRSDYRFKSMLRFIVTVAVIAVLAFAFPAATVQAYSGHPTTTIMEVVKDTKVTVKIQNLPASQTFVVRMNTFGTLGVGGPVVATFDSGSGGTLTSSFNIPAFLKGQKLIAIRFEGSGGPYAYDWFTNDASGTSPTPVPTVAPVVKIPTFSIVSVVAGEKVTIKTADFPKDHKFTVLMGNYGTKGIGGTAVATTDSGAGGSFEATYSIPAGLKANERIAIRMESTDGFFAYNWFWNATAAVSPTPSPTTTPVVVAPIPTFSITAVVRDDKVTIRTSNLPKDQTFTVRMGVYGTAAIGGTVVATTSSGAGGTQDLTYTIPAGLKGSTKIAIRMDSNLGFFAYNWFWNNTYP